MRLILDADRIVAEATDDYTGPMEWIEAPEGYVPGSFVLPGQDTPIPQQCTRRQGLLALLSYGIKRSDIEAQIEAIEDELEREEAWVEYLANDWELTNPRLQQMWAALGGQPDLLGELFRLAVTL